MICASVCTTRLNHDGSARERTAQGCGAALPTCARGARFVERKAAAARKRIGTGWVRGDGQSNLQEHVALLTQRRVAASHHCEQSRVPGGRQILAAIRAGAPYTPEAREFHPQRAPPTHGPG